MQSVPCVSSKLRVNIYSSLEHYETQERLKQAVCIPIGYHSLFCLLDPHLPSLCVPNFSLFSFHLPSPPKEVFPQL